MSASTRPSRAPLPLEGARTDLAAVTLSPDGKVLASATVDGRIELHELATGRRLDEKTLGDADVANELAFSPDGKRLLAATRRGVIVVYAVER